MSFNTFKQKVSNFTPYILLILVLINKILSFFSLDFEINNEMFLGAIIFIYLSNQVYISSNIKTILEEIESTRRISLSRAIETCLSKKSKIKNLRIYASSTGVIFPHLSQQLNNIKEITNCNIIVRRDTETFETNSPFNQHVENHINMWENLKTERKITNLVIKYTESIPQIYNIIVDEEFLIYGYFKHDSNSLSEVDITTPYLTTNKNKTGKINDTIDWFDKYFESLK